MPKNFYTRGEVSIIQEATSNDMEFERVTAFEATMYIKKYGRQLLESADVLPPVLTTLLAKGFLDDSLLYLLVG